MTLLYKYYENRWPLCGIENSKVSQIVSAVFREFDFPNLVYLQCFSPKVRPIVLDTESAFLLNNIMFLWSQQLKIECKYMGRYVSVVFCALLQDLSVFIDVGPRIPSLREIVLTYSCNVSLESLVTLCQSFNQLRTISVTEVRITYFFENKNKWRIGTFRDFFPDECEVSFCIYCDILWYL